MKLNEVIERAGLNLSTTQYVLRNHRALPRMPKAGSQGLHRVFNLDQAFRLAFAVRLVAAGVKLKTAAKVVKIVDLCVERATKERNEPGKYIGVRQLDEGDWSVVICDGDYLRLMRGVTVFLPESRWEEWFQVSQMKSAPQALEPLERYELNLTMLRQRLMPT